MFNVNQIHYLKDKNIKTILRGKFFNLLNKSLLVMKEKNESLKKKNIKKRNLNRNKSLPYLITNKNPNLIKFESYYNKWEDDIITPYEFINNFKKEEIEIIKENKSVFQIDKNENFKNSNLNTNLIDILNDEEIKKENKDIENIIHNKKRRMTNIPKVDFSKFFEKKISIKSNSTICSTKDDINIKQIYLKDNKLENNEICSENIHSKKKIFHFNRSEKDLLNISKNKNYIEKYKLYEKNRMITLNKKLMEINNKKRISKERKEIKEIVKSIEQKKNVYIENIQKLLIQNYNKKRYIDEIKD